MLKTTTSTVEGKTIQAYHGIVTSEVIIGANIVRDLFASITDIVGGRSGSYESKLKESKELALQNIEQEARKLGANAIIGIDLDFETVGERGGMLMCVASGTAVTIV